MTRVDRRIGYDHEGFEHREMCVGMCACRQCDTLVECWADTAAWTGQQGDVLRHHRSYGRAQGVCPVCDSLVQEPLEGGGR